MATEPATANEFEIESQKYNMADFEWLRQKGFTERDSTSLATEGVGPGVSASILRACMNNKELNITRGGRRLLSNMYSEVGDGKDEKDSGELNQPNNKPALVIPAAAAVQESQDDVSLHLDRPSRPQTVISNPERPVTPVQVSQDEEPVSVQASQDEEPGYLEGRISHLPTGTQQPPCTGTELDDDSPNNISSWLKEKGLSQCDIKVLADKGFVTAQGFETLLPEDLNNLQLTRAGKRLLQGLMDEFKEMRNNSTSTCPSCSVVTQPLPWANRVRFIVDVPIGATPHGSQVTEYSCELTHPLISGITQSVKTITFRYVAKLDHMKSEDKN